MNWNTNTTTPIQDMRDLIESMPKNYGKTAYICLRKHEVIGEHHLFVKDGQVVCSDRKDCPVCGSRISVSGGESPLIPTM